MEENFENIDWQNIDALDIHEDILAAIENLSSNDKDVRETALSDLFDMIWHQGSIYVQSAFPVPYLIERLQKETDLELSEIILFDLAYLATGTSYCETHQNLSYYEDRRNTAEFQERMEEEILYANATHTAVYKGIDIYLNLLGHDSFKVRIAAAYTPSNSSSANSYNSRNFCNLSSLASQKPLPWASNILPTIFLNASGLAFLNFSAISASKA